LPSCCREKGRHEHVDTAPAPTIAENVGLARGRVGLRRLAKHAEVPARMIAAVIGGCIAFDPEPLRRLLATAEAVVGNEPRPR
jgi:hypothetical protein